MKDWIQVVLNSVNNKIIKDANDLLLSKQKELEDTIEALRRCRNLLASEKELTSRLVNIIKEHEGTKWQVEIFNKN